MRRAEERGQCRISGARVPWDRSTSPLSVPVKEEREREREKEEKDLGLQSSRTNVRDNTRGRLLPIPWLAFPFLFSSVITRGAYAENVETRVGSCSNRAFPARVGNSSR